MIAKILTIIYTKIFTFIILEILRFYNSCEKIMTMPIKHNFMKGVIFQ